MPFVAASFGVAVFGGAVFAGASLVGAVFVAVSFAGASLVGAPFPDSSCLSNTLYFSTRSGPSNSGANAFVAFSN
ncbi:MAG: pentapeptide repeat-containing protein [Planctomycetaceae bacterium]